VDNIKAVFFDFDNTIVDFMKSDIYGIGKLVGSLPIKVDFDKFLDVSVENIIRFHDLMKEGKESPQNVHKYRLYNTLQHFYIDWEEHYLEVYLKHYIESTSCFPRVEEVIRYLHGKVKLGILTNAYDSVEQKRRIDNAGIARHFDDIVVCSEIGTYKPSKEAFLYLVNKYKLDPSNCIYIGDSEKYDIEGAKNAGLYSIKIVRDKAVKSDSLADYVCNDFENLLKVITEELKI